MDSPAVERRSRKIAPINRIVEDVPPEEFNNDEEERSRLRMQAENDIKNYSAADKRLSVSEKSLSEHFQSCIQLAAENKINAKNAFSFKLIDLLHMMLNKKKQIKDFSEVTSSLDAGIKIYSYRVDNVHSNTMKMATSINVTSNKKKSSDDNVDEPDVENQEKIRKKKLNRKTRKTTIANNIDQINRNGIIENDEIVHNKLSNETFITNSAIFDSSKIRWHLNTSSNFWMSTESASLSLDMISIEFPSISDDAVLCRTFNDFRLGEESVSHELSTKEKISSVFEYNPETENDNFFENDTPMIDEDLESQNNDIEAPLHNAEYLSKIMSSSDFISDISKLITSEKSDYSYFNSQLLKKNWNLRNMRHWNPFKKKGETEEKRLKVDKKELLNFNELDDLDVYDEKLTAGLTITSSAPREKFLITPITHFNINEFFRLKIWREMFVIPNTNPNEEQPSDLEETINDYNYNNPNDSQHYIPEQYEDDYRDENNDDGANDVHEAIEKNAFIGDNLVEIPNKVSKIQIPYMVKDKSVNMKNLKLTIWNKIESQITEVNSKSRKKDLDFSEVCKLIFLDDRKISEELTIPILFNAILQLANDKNLYLFSSEENDVTDFMVLVPNSINPI